MSGSPPLKGLARRPGDGPWKLRMAATPWRVAPDPCAVEATAAAGNEVRLCSSGERTLARKRRGVDGIIGIRLNVRIAMWRSLSGRSRRARRYQVRVARWTRGRAGGSGPSAGRRSIPPFEYHAVFCVMVKDSAPVCHGRACDRRAPCREALQAAPRPT